MDVFTAIADPVRRSILVSLLDGPRTAGEVAADYPISRPAISRHLRVLREAALVTVDLVGRERIYHLERDPLTELGAWVNAFGPSGERSWEQRLDALGTEVRRTSRERRKPETRPARKARPARKESA